MILTLEQIREITFGALSVEEDGGAFVFKRITVAYGTNDWSGTSYAQITTEVPAYFSKLRELYPRAKIVYISPIWRGDTDRVTAAGDFDAHRDRVSEIVNLCSHLTSDLQFLR